jgi:hypothetical protein
MKPLMVAKVGMKLIHSHFGPFIIKDFLELKVFIMIL